MSCLHSTLMDRLKERKLNPKSVDVYIIGFSEEVIVKYNFTFEEFQDRNEIHIYSWYVKDDVLIIHATIEPVSDIKDHMVWNNKEKLDEYNDVRQRILKERIENLKKEFIKL